MPVVDASIVVDWVAPGSDPDAPAGRLLARLGDEPLLAPGVPWTRASRSRRVTSRRFPCRWAARRPDQIHRRTVSGVRSATWAASRTSIISTPSTTSMVQDYYTTRRRH